MAKTGPLLCGGVTVFAPLFVYQVPSTARVGVIGIGGLGHMALQFANKWGCEVHAFTTSDNKAEEAHTLGAHYVHNTRQDGALKKIAGSLDLIISTVNASVDLDGFLGALRPKGRAALQAAETTERDGCGILFGWASVFAGSPMDSSTVTAFWEEADARGSKSEQRPICSRG